MFAKIKSIIQRQSFHPGFIGIFTNPFYFARKGLAQHLGELASEIYGSTLDVGCGIKPYRDLFDVHSYFGLEINRTKALADCYYDGQILPFKDKAFDSVFTSQVLEHVFEPHDYLTEINRVLKENGALLLTAPFVWDEHEQPWDFARYSSFGIQYLLRKQDFQVIEFRKSMPGIRAIFQMINLSIYKMTVTKHKWLNYLVTFLLISPFNIIGEILSRIILPNHDLYLDNIVLARKRIVS